MNERVAFAGEVIGVAGHHFACDLGKAAPVINKAKAIPINGKSRAGLRGMIG